MQHSLLLQRNLVYTGITRGRKLVVLIGQKKALAMAVRNNRTERRFSGLLAKFCAAGNWQKGRMGRSVDIVGCLAACSAAFPMPT